MLSGVPFLPSFALPPPAYRVRSTLLLWVRNPKNHPEAFADTIACGVGCQMGPAAVDLGGGEGVMCTGAAAPPPPPNTRKVLYFPRFTASAAVAAALCPRLLATLCSENSRNRVTQLSNLGLWTACGRLRRAGLRDSGIPRSRPSGCMKQCTTPHRPKQTGGLLKVYA
jgi:hypothetical protein